MQVHIGRNQWLDEKVYNNIVNKSKNPKMFIDHALLAVFGSATLETSTITGRVSNKSTSKSAEKYAVLDHTLLAACKGIIYRSKRIFFRFIEKNFSILMFCDNSNRLLLSIHSMKNRVVIFVMIKFLSL